MKDYRSPGFSESATEKRVCRRKLCKDEFLCNKTSTRVYCSDKCNGMESAAVRAEKEEAVKRIVETQKCPLCEKKGLKNSLGRNRTLIYCLNKDCDYSFIYGKRGGRSGFTESSSDPVDEVYGDVSEEEADDEGEDGSVENVLDDGTDDSDAIPDEECPEEASEDGERKDAEDGGEEEEEPPEVHEEELADSPTVEELTEGCGLYTEQTPRLTDKQLAYLLATRTEEERSRILALAKGLHDVIHMLKSMLWQARKTSCPSSFPCSSCRAGSPRGRGRQPLHPTRLARRPASAERS